jgi:hypothetical protein
MAETPCQKCKRERDRYRKEAAELRVARENDAKRWKAAVERERTRADGLMEELERARAALRLIARACVEHAHVQSNPVAAVMAITQIHDTWAEGGTPSEADLEWPRKRREPGVLPSR